MIAIPAFITAIFYWCIGGSIINILAWQNIMLHFDMIGLIGFMICFDIALKQAINTNKSAAEHEKNRAQSNYAYYKTLYQRAQADAYAKAHNKPFNKQNQQHSQQRSSQQQSHAHRQSHSTTHRSSASSHHTSNRPPPSNVAEALSVFTLSSAFSKQQLNARFKELMFGAHPDLGGKHDDAIRLNIARDILLKHLEQCARKNN